jgi:hypothetical protein
MNDDRVLWIARRLGWLVGLRCRECYVLPWNKRKLVRCDKLRDHSFQHYNQHEQSGWDTACGHRLA